MQDSLPGLYKILYVYEQAISAIVQSHDRDQKSSVRTGVTQKNQLEWIRCTYADSSTDHFIVNDEWPWKV